MPMRYCKHPTKPLTQKRAFFQRLKHSRNWLAPGAMGLLLLACSLQPAAQFREDFNGTRNEFGSGQVPGWNAVRGDGIGIFTQRVAQGMATLRVDARPDPRNIWYAFIHRDVSQALNLTTLAQKGSSLRISARLRASHAPRRINLFLKSQASGDEWLREFDLPRKDQWYEISTTTGPFRHTAGEPLLAQVSFMDWGNRDVYQLDVDWIRVDVVNQATASADKGVALPYRPALAPPGSFATERLAIADATVDRSYPQLPLPTLAHNDSLPVLVVDEDRLLLLKWDLSDLKGKTVKGAGQLEFYTHALFRLAKNPKDFGELRVCEILSGDSAWNETEVSYNSFLAGLPEHQVINEQTIVDVPLTPGNGSKTTVTISQPVLQRLIDGTTLGIALRPLGLITAVLKDRCQEGGRYAARLRLNVQ